MSGSLEFGCRCEKVAGEIAIAEPAAIRCVCYCRDCQAQARHFGLEDSFMDAEGGIEIVQVAPGNVRFTKGREHIRALKLIPAKRGVIRFYAGCCDTPLFSTPPSESWPVLGFPVAGIDADPGTRERAFGPVEFVPFRSGQTGKGTPGKGPFRHMAAMLRFMRRAKRLGKMDNPVWENGRPIAEPRLLTNEERRKAYPA